MKRIVNSERRWDRDIALLLAKAMINGGDETTMRVFDIFSPLNIPFFGAHSTRAQSVLFDNAFLVMQKLSSHQVWNLI